VHLDAAWVCPVPPDPSGLSDSELLELVVGLLGKVTKLERIVGEQRAEIARPKGLKGRPDIKPSGMERGATPKLPPQASGTGKSAPRVTVAMD